MEKASVKQRTIEWHTPAIDSLRGWAIFLVMAVHTSHWVTPDSAWLKELAYFGATGVSLFFLVSAMTLCMAHERRNADSTRAFFIRRAFRIFPMWWVAVAIYLALKGLGPRDWVPEGIGLQEIFLSIFGLHGWHPVQVNAIMPIGWSVGTELSFYLLFPLLMLWVTSLRRAFIFLLAAVAFSIWWIPLMRIALGDFIASSSHHLSIAYTFITYMSLPAQFPVFAFGFLAYYLLRYLPENATRRGALMLALFVALYIIFSGSGARTAVIGSVLIPLPSVLYGIIYMFFTLGVLRARVALFDNAVMQWLGKISYSAYLLHMVILGKLQAIPRITAAYPIHGDGEYVLALLAVVALTAAAASITYLFIEMPMIRLGSRYSRTWGAGDGANHVRA